MDMQDKDFDQLFRSKLEDLELKPSASVWEGVNEGLSNYKRRKTIPILSIAASIIVLMTAGILLISKKENVARPLTKNNLATVKPVKTGVPISVKAIISPKAALLVKNNRVDQRRVIKDSRSPTIVTRVIKPKSDLPVAQANREVLTAALYSKNSTEMADSSKILAAVTPSVKNDSVLPKFTDNQINALPPDEKIATVQQPKKHGIHGLGDVLNVMIAAVDKRKDKIIEFGDSEGDGATVTAVNFGIIKVKKEN